MSNSPEGEGGVPRKPAEQSSDAFQLTHAELAAILSSTQNMLAMLDRDGRFVKVGPTAMPFLSRPPNDLLGKRVDEVLPPDRAEYFLDRIRQALDLQRAIPLEYNLPDGTGDVWYEGRVTPVGAGTVLWMARDVTGGRRTAEALAQQQDFLRRVIDLDPNFIFAKDRHGRFTLVNRTLAEAYGTTAEDLIGKTDADFNPNTTEVEHFRRDDLEVMDSQRDKVIPEEVITDAAGRVRMLQTIKRAIIGPDGRADQVLGVATDITERKKLEEQLLQSRKMEAIGLLAGGIAHDFNNLLTAILGSANLVLEKLEARDPCRWRVEEIHEAAERAASLTRQLLAFSRKQVLQPKILDLNEIVEGSTQMLRRVIGEDVELVTSLDPALGPAKADPIQIQQVIVNLAVNARDAMPEGGRLTVETLNAQLDEGDARRPVGLPLGPYVLVRVSDTGHGMDEPTRARVFDPFFTTKEMGRGTGLGLSTVHGIVTQSGGYITVESEPGHGATFTIWLPQAEGPVELAAPPAYRGPVTGSETVLVVEDEAVVRSLACKALRRSGYHVLEAGSGGDALRICSEHVGRIHLLLTDVVMPGMSGPTLARMVTENRGDIRVLYMSGYPVDYVEQHGSLDPAFALIQKPFSVDDLARKVRAALD